MENIRINTEEIKSLSNKLCMHGKEILNAYHKDANVALNMGKECLVLTGLNTDVFFRTLEMTYESLYDRIETLATFLNNNVAMGYDETSQITANNFNSKLGSQLETLLGVGVMRRPGVTVTTHYYGGGPVDYNPPDGMPIGEPTVDYNPPDGMPIGEPTVDYNPPDGN